MSGHSDENSNSIFKIAFNLAMTCLVSGLIIAGVYYTTADAAAQKAVDMKNAAMQALVQDADKFNPVEGHEGWYKAEKGGKTIAYVVPSESKGFGGPIQFLVAVTSEGKVLNYDIIKHNETPGLGDKGGKDPFKSQLIGKKIENLQVVKDPSDKENVQAMTGATISSRAVTNGVKKAVEEVVEFTGGK
ncbi:RnfABCDGE type electron transport complex subunit G [Pelotomaculum terephthalicicum JT]|uniref:RnfABCDGE type electron transport complex subunit G n=1 Tax=Pelotomaculum TaxID=191373 RepID=UPI0009CBF5FD|nr:MULTISPECIES: RnfABCDGE type electron transport complex subunit G [Pelotomaculum]MCG9967215.1 RnfABCDGE type electron transport complex subunit G [Pelotomaculum terephthalicicum JT]OPX91130.1 MAG: Electron transport complex protein RnfG [Pelotomaculum sp. PtaB.Bin117]OPY61542.1 MAG: Electron transport complex protein RnfG [Pelotomaculum sp. PtaU1.Bin065]